MGRLWRNLFPSHRQLGRKQFDIFIVAINKAQDEIPIGLC